jgi:threonine dehydrogenase-like Zn-dependent dehydrogenase
VASDVRQFEIGDYVTADSLVPCRRLDCRTCRAGLWNACPRGYLLGLQADGVFGELAVVPAGSLHSIEPLIRRYGTAAGMRFASLAEPLGVALHAYEQAMRWIRHRRPQVMIHGAGPIGLLFAWTARLTGAERIIVSEPNPLRAAIAGKFADAVVHPSEAQGPFSDDAFCAGADIVFDACGRVDVRRLMAGLAPGGALLSAARNGQELCFETDPLITNGQAIIGTRGHVGHLPAAIGMLAGCDLDPDMFITRSLDGLTQLHELLRDTRQLADEFKVSCRVSTPALRGVAAR